MSSSVGSLWNELELSCSQLVKVIVNARNKISDIEREMIDRMAAVNSDGQKRLTTARRILAATESRLNKINAHLRQATEEDLLSAARIATSPLVVPTDSLTTLITESQIPPIEASQIKPTLEKLLSGVVLQKQKIAF